MRVSCRHTQTSHICNSQSQTVLFPSSVQFHNILMHYRILLSTTTTTSTCVFQFGFWFHQCNLLVLTILLCVRWRSVTLYFLCDWDFRPPIIIALMECECLALCLISWFLLSFERQWFIVNAQLLWSIFSADCWRFRCHFTEQSQFIRLSIGQWAFHEFPIEFFEFLFVANMDESFILGHMRDNRRPILIRRYVGITFWLNDSKMMGDLFMIILFLFFWHIILNLLFWLFCCRCWHFAFFSFFSEKISFNFNSFLSFTEQMKIIWNNSGFYYHNQFNYNEFCS